MKKSCFIAAIAALASFGFANNIQWSIESIEDYKIDGARSLLSTADGEGSFEVKFLNTALYSVDQKTGLAWLTAGNDEGLNTSYYTVSEVPGFASASGEWEDKATSDPATSYFLGVYDVGTDNLYYLSSTDDTRAFVISTDDMISLSLYPEPSFEAHIGDAIFKDTTLSFAVAAVPEPAVATLALAGIALLFRRRKNA